MGVSVTDPISRAFARMSRITFQPFDLGKWFVLGFSAWLATLAEGGSGNFNFPSGGGSGSSGPPGRFPPGSHGGPAPAPDPLDWIMHNLSWLVPVAVIVLLVIIGLSLVIMWLRARGKFMFIDNIVHNRALIVQPWKEFRAEGNSLLQFSVVLMLISWLLFLLEAGLCLLIAWPDIQARSFGGPAILAIVTGVLLFLATGLATAIIGACLHNFVAPVMYVRRIRVMAAWHEFRTVILPGNAGPIALYLLMKLLLSICAAVVMLVAGCATCCLGFLPYLRAVVTLPALVFLQAYPLYFLEEFGYRLFPDDPAAPGGFPVVMSPPPGPVQ